MEQSIRTFVRRPGNDAAIEAVLSATGLPPGSMSPVPIRVVIEGPHASGKSALIQGAAHDAALNGADAVVFACSGADIAMALQFEADDSFFDHLGSAPVLLVDDISLIPKADKGDQLLSLMLAERDRLGLSTVLTCRDSHTNLNLPQSSASIATFAVIPIEALDHEGRVAFVRQAFESHQNAGSPQLSREAAECIARAFGESFVDLENAARYLATDEDCAAFATIGERDAIKLLHLEE